MKITNNQIKFIKSLHQSKFRQMYENFIAEGDKLCKHLILFPKFEIVNIVATPSWIENHFYLIKKYDEKILEAELHQMEQISNLKTKTEIMLILKKSESIFNYSLMKGQYSFYLDGIQDPGNVGTIIRIADWFGIKNVIRTTDSADFFNPKTVQATMGSMVAVNLCTADREQLIIESKEIKSFIMEADGKSLQKIEFENEGIIILGSEGQGVSSIIKSNLKNASLVSIDGASNKSAESLNVSIAAGIVGHQVSLR